MEDFVRFKQVFQDATTRNLMQLISNQQLLEYTQSNKKPIICKFKLPTENIESRYERSNTCFPVQDINM